MTKYVDIALSDLVSFIWELVFLGLCSYVFKHCQKSRLNCFSFARYFDACVLENLVLKKCKSCPVKIYKIVNIIHLFIYSIGFEL